MCEACEERLSIATVTELGIRSRRNMQMCAACLSDALAVGWQVSSD